MKKRIVIISFPWRSEGPYIFLSDLLKIINEVTENIFLINGNTKDISTGINVSLRDIGLRMHYLSEINPKFFSLILWMFKMLIIQIKTSYELFQLRNDIDIVIFYLAFPYFILPLLLSKLLKKKSIEVVTRSKSNNIFLSAWNSIIFSLLDGISPESYFLIEDLGLEKYKSKILHEGARFINTTVFYNSKLYFDRQDIIGFVGRFVKDKGILEFIDSIPYVLMERPEFKFIIIGEGSLSSEIEKKIVSNNLADSVRFLGWVSNVDLTKYLNELKLLVVPTKYDGFPTIILESMACGTPVIANMVGGIPYLVKDKKTGFIFNNTSPELMANDIINVLNFDGIENVIFNAEQLILEKYTFNRAVERYKKILNEINY